MASTPKQIFLPARVGGVVIISSSSYQNTLIEDSIWHPFSDRFSPDEDGSPGIPVRATA
ncbi:hypothetical protein HPP92_025354 [Vanilla planifolia]|uniref:Uncharacterized protein n=1 Tax=Vanilla planifolia TaxID=51239 RepID=A0A835PKG6_VANPL|nr:hypothetical protein HPP92_025624 [Vanilla planifolia]KAG0454050.1 hypothetical protein HPP92_025354 [Vanilla planifolia]